MVNRQLGMLWRQNPSMKKASSINPDCSKCANSKFLISTPLTSVLQKNFRCTIPVRRVVLINKVFDFSF